MLKDAHCCTLSWSVISLKIAGEQIFAMFGKGAERHFQEDVAATQMASRKLHRHGLLARVEVPTDLSQMGLIKILGQKRGQILAEQLFRRSAEGSFGDRIDKRISPVSSMTIIASEAVSAKSGNAPRYRAKGFSPAGKPPPENWSAGPRAQTSRAAPRPRYCPDNKGRTVAQ